MGIRPLHASQTRVIRLRTALSRRRRRRRPRMVNCGNGTTVLQYGSKQSGAIFQWYALCSVLRLCALRSGKPEPVGCRQDEASAVPASAVPGVPASAVPYARVTQLSSIADAPPGGAVFCSSATHEPVDGRCNYTLHIPAMLHKGSVSELDSLAKVDRD